MIVKNASPFAFATHVVSTRPPAPEMLVVVKGVFSFAPGKALEPLDRADAAPTGDTYADDDDDRAGECIYPSDFADKKQAAEVFLRGTWYAPKGRAAKEGEVAFVVVGGVDAFGGVLSEECGALLRRFFAGRR